MKTLLNLSLCSVAITLASCGVMDKINQPISANGYNPLDKTGAVSGSSSGADSSSETLVNTNSHGFNIGDIVEVVIPNTALFARVPKAGDSYKKVLNVGDTLNVLGGKKDFIKVVTDTADIGYVSSVMVATQGFLTNSKVVDPSIRSEGADEVPIVPDEAPEPVVKGIGAADPAPNASPAPIPNISAPVPVEVEPDPGLIIPEVPDPTPVVPSLPDTPAPEPSNPGLTE